MCVCVCEGPKTFKQEVSAGHRHTRNANKSLMKPTHTHTGTHTHICTWGASSDGFVPHENVGHRQPVALSSTRGGRGRWAVAKPKINVHAEKKCSAQEITII